VSLPYRWHPDGVVGLRGTAEGRRLKPGDLMPWEHRVYAVTELREVPEDQWTEQERDWVEQSKRASAPYYVSAPYPRPVFVSIQPHPVPDDPVGAGRARKRDGLTGRAVAWKSFGRYPDGHYPICATCGEPTPCREVVARRLAEQAGEVMDRYDQEGICPACQEPVTARQGRETFGWNLEVPGGPPVTFHTRRSCGDQLYGYRERLSKAGYFTANPVEDRLL
jgi:hypothetical protein